jgi:glycosyltransferase involved in cell wall biosynthesis
MISALSPSKRVDVGIEAVSRLPDAHLVVAGDGPLRQTVDELAARRLPGRFTRLSLSPAQMPALYRSADVFLHLSKEEAFGNVFEAMACGLPIVAHDTPPLQWIVGGREYLVDAGDPMNVARSLELAKRASESERQTRVEDAARFSWSRIGKLHREFLTEVVARAR